MSDGNPLDIIQVPIDGDTHQTRAYIPLDVISEDEVERLRAENLEINDGEQSGASAPGVKDDTADQQARALAEEALAKPIEGDDDAEPTTPADALG